VSKNVDSEVEGCRIARKKKGCVGPGSPAKSLGVEDDSAQGDEKKNAGRKGRSQGTLMQPTEIHLRPDGSTKSQTRRGYQETTCH